MALPHSVILVCAGEDAARAAQTRHPLLDLCLGVTARGTLGWLREGTPSPGSYLGIRDLPASAVPAETLTQDVLRIVAQTQARGVFADFERNSPATGALCAALDDALHAAALPFFVPAARAEDTQYAYLTVETAVSGGSLSGMLEELRAAHGIDRLAALLRPVSADFSLPSASPDGMNLTQEARLALRERTGAQVFFSKELCAKYFTYMDESARGHFVLFDDESTLEEKIELLARHSIHHLFALYPDVRHML